MSEQDDQRKADWLRKVCGVSASWSPDGALVALTLGPDTTPLPDSDRETQPSISPQERERRDRLARRELAQRSSGGPVPKLDAVG